MNLLNGKLHKPPNLPPLHQCRMGMPVQEPPPLVFSEDANPQDYAWYDSNNKDPYGTGPKRVKAKLPNAFGLYDVHGNLREWVQDFSSADYSADANRVTDPKGPLEGDDRVTRGGYYSESRKKMRSSHREPKTETTKYVGVGIRLCVDP